MPGYTFFKTRPGYWNPFLWAVHTRQQCAGVEILFCFHLMELFSVLFEAPPPWGLAQIQDFCLLLAFLNDLNDNVISLSCVLTTGTYHTEQGDGGQVRPFLSYFFCVLNKTCLKLLSHTSRSVCSEIQACRMPVLPYIKKKITSYVIMNREALNWHSYCLIIIFTDRGGSCGGGRTNDLLHTARGMVLADTWKQIIFLWYGHLEPPEEKFVCFTLGRSWLSFLREQQTFLNSIFHI